VQNFGLTNVLIDEVVHFEYGKVIRSDIKPGSIERSIDLEMEY
jgi:hypothetical protein